MDSSSIQSSYSHPRIRKIDVFLSFGAGIRKTFIDHLYAHLTRNGISAFRDDRDIEKGEDISSQIRRAIEDSRVSIVVFSEGYADSTWRLEEMAAIAERNAAGQTVVPVFYDMDLSDVRHQRGTYEDAFAKHAKEFPGKVDRWRAAMKHLTNLFGWDVRHRPEFEEIEEIVQQVKRLLGHTKLSRWADDLVGIDSRVQELESLLNLSSKDDFKVIGIWGMAGIGKTILAQLLYEKISYQFDACCFISDISNVYRNVGVIGIHKQLLRETLYEKIPESYGLFESAGILRNRLSNKKVLIVLDNVDESEQLKKLAINPKLLDVGSRIIITTRDEHILKVYGTDAVYKVPLLNYSEAHELFCRKAFGSDDPSSIYEEVTSKTLEYAQNLPLAIVVLGSLLCSKDAAFWGKFLHKLQHIPPQEVMRVLQTSYEKLDPEEREIFLHIACFFKGEKKGYVNRILDCCGLNPAVGIPVLIEKSLITIKNEEIQMHKMLQEMGKQIVREKSPSKRELWSRLWLNEDFYLVMTEKPPINVEAIVLNQKEDGDELGPLNAKQFSEMNDLRLLMLYHKNILGNLDFLSNKLQFLSWHHYPFTSLPSRFEPNRLVELNMPGSCIRQLWEGIKHLPKLRRMDLSNSKSLQMTPDFSGIPNLEWLDLTGCTRLSEVDQSIRDLKKLAFLSLRNCRYLVRGDSVSGLSSLKVLDLAGCTSLERTPYFKGLSNLEFLGLEHCTSLKEVDESIGVLTKLKFLRLKDCANLVNIPHSINNIIDSLEILDLRGCSRLESLPFKERTKGAVDSLEPFRHQSQSLISQDLDLPFSYVHESSSYFDPMSEEEEKEQEEAKRDSPNWQVPSKLPFCPMDSDSIQCNPSSQRICKYDVFLSFGEDSRNTFADDLYDHLRSKGIFAFKNDRKLQKGELIVPQLLQAIQDCRVSVVIFSKDYADSTWCLEEMAAIAESKEKLGQTVLPIFYGMDPSEVRRHGGVYRFAFDLHAEKFKKSYEKVDRWRRAMRDLANLAGWVLQDKSGFEEIQKIAQEIIIKLGHKFSALANDLVGIQSHVEELESLLKLSSEVDDFRTLGIWGMDGIGKTIQAKILYDRISYQFDACYFLENVSKTFSDESDDGAIALQKQILSETLDETNLEAYCPFEIARIVRNKLSNKKVLIVLDDIDESEQLKQLAIHPKLLGTGSRIIITTRDEHILKIYGVDKVYKAPLLNDDDAHELFWRKCFKRDDTSSSFKGLIVRVLKYAQNLPLAIQELSSYLKTHDATQWGDAFDQLLNNPLDGIMNVLQMSFEKLKPTEREIFLHIACFFKGKREDSVKRILGCCELYPAIGIPVLEEKSLITVENEEIHMHATLQELGREIARKESPLPELRSRLWRHEDFHHVMMTEMEAIPVEALVLDQEEEASELSAEAFSKMRDLSLLILYHKKISESLIFLSNKLQYLSWHGYPFTSLPLSFEPDRLVELNMPGGRMEQLWKGIKYLPYLRRMDLSNCKALETTPDFSRIQNLERLDLTGCINLKQVHPSIGGLGKLAFLSLRNCSKLVCLFDRSSTSSFSSLKFLDIGGCTKLYAKLIC